MRQGLGINVERQLENIFSAAGEWFQVVRAGHPARLQGARNREKATSRHFIQFRPKETVQAEDILVSEVSGESFTVTQVERIVELGQFCGLKAFYKTQHEIEQEKKALAAQGPTFNIGTAHGSIIGTQQTATIHNKFDFAALDAQIDRQGGEDTAELKAMIAEIRDTLTQNEHVPSGVLARFSAVIERHAWIAEPVSHILLLWGLGQLKVPLA